MRNTIRTFALTASMCIAIGVPAQAFRTGIYPDYFAEVLGKGPEESRAKLDEAWNKLFLGNPETETVYYPVGTDMAYIYDAGSADVRSEGISYGMMIAVQMDKKHEFDRIWKWAKTYMWQKDGTYKGYFAWHCRTDGMPLQMNPAPDGEEYIATALLFASNRWGNGKGVLDYGKEARALLKAMLHRQDSKVPGATNMFDAETKQVVFVPTPGRQAKITDPSYHLPAFYELWALWADKRDRAFWKEAAPASREFFRKAAHPETGLMSDYAEFDGRPVDMHNGKHQNFGFDAWRPAMNIALDKAWMDADPWQAEWIDRYLSFFVSQGIGTYGDKFTLSGEVLRPVHSLGLVSTNAMAAARSGIRERKEFIEAVWNASPPMGKNRYFDGMLYFFALLDLSGNYRAYAPGGSPRGHR
jgi:oligosaccharide reducing-end xylanase